MDHFRWIQNIFSNEVFSGLNPRRSGYGGVGEETENTDLGKKFPVIENIYKFDLWGKEREVR